MGKQLAVQFQYLIHQLPIGMSLDIPSPVSLDPPELTKNIGYTIYNKDHKYRNRYINCGFMATFRVKNCLDCEGLISPLHS